jgi:hypothetical protein
VIIHLGGLLNQIVVEPAYHGELGDVGVGQHRARGRVRRHQP